MSEALAVGILLATAAVLALLLPLALHRLHLLRMAARPAPPPAPPVARGELPRVTVQIPIYNERRVVERVIDAACSLRYPRRLLDVQVLDDSDDGTSSVAARAVGRWRRRGVDVRHLRRGSRIGFKAGALRHGLGSARGEYLLVLDADFVPDPDLVHRLLPPFGDPEVGMVQARWDHLNETENALTRAQALLLDGHFFVEQAGRYRAGVFLNFNGTAGIWRRRCLEDAGGWQDDTLTEDLDLSYRAQMRGWRMVFLEEVGVGAELPSTAGALRIQQRRWAQGGVQTARKLLPTLLRGPWTLGVKREAAVHLLAHLAHPLTVLLGLLLLPSAVARRALGLDSLLFLDVGLFGAVALPFGLFYARAARARKRPWRRVFPDVVRTLALGIGLSAPVSRAVLRGLGGRPDPFERTPKTGSVDGAGGAAEIVPGAALPAGSADAFLTVGLGTVLLGSVLTAASLGFWASLPFLLLFSGGYLGLGGRQVRETWAAVSGAGSPLVVGEPPSGAGESHAFPDEERQHRRPEEESSPERLRPGSGAEIRSEPDVPERGEAA